MTNKFIISTVTALALLGSTMAAADCPAYLSAEEGVPCFAKPSTERTAETATPTIMPTASVGGEQYVANIDSWVMMAQVEQ